MRDPDPDDRQAVLMTVRARRRSTAESRAALRERRAELTDTGPAMDAAAAFLGVRPRSVSETRQRLCHLGYPAPLVDTVVERLIEMDYLNDDAFARAWVESRDRARPRGETALRRELAVKGILRATVDEVLAERHDTSGPDDPNHAAAEALLARRRSALDRETDPARRRQKAYALLARNGFDPETCHQAVSALMARA